jgi:1,4-dihydroxy-2-naphthoate polyprenyltransferase
LVRSPPRSSWSTTYNLRDRSTDARVGKRTLAVRLGRRGAILEYAGLLATAYAIPIGLALCASQAWRALPIATAPLAVRRLRELVRAVTGPEFNACLAATAQLLLLHGVLFAIGLVVR